MEQRGVVIGAILTAIIVAGALFYFLVPGEQDANNLAARVSDGSTPTPTATSELLTQAQAQQPSPTAGGTMAPSPSPTDEGTRTPAATPSVSGAQDQEEDQREDVAATAETGSSGTLLLVIMITTGLGAVGVWQIAGRLS